MHQYGAVCPRLVPAAARAGVQHLLLCELVSIRSGAARFRYARLCRGRMARAVNDISIRFAAADDAGLLLRFIKELAIFEREPNAVVATEADLVHHGFGSRPQFEA